MSKYISSSLATISLVLPRLLSLFLQPCKQELCHYSLFWQFYHDRQLSLWWVYVGYSGLVVKYCDYRFIFFNYCIFFFRCTKACCSPEDEEGKRWDWRLDPCLYPPLGCRQDHCLRQNYRQLHLLHQGIQRDQATDSHEEHEAVHDWHEKLSCHSWRARVWEARRKGEEQGIIIIS